MIPVTSTNLKAIGYDENTSTLRIEFHSGTYEYLNVPIQVFESLLNSSSKGKYHHAYIKNSYSYRKI